MTRASRSPTSDRSCSPSGSHDGHRSTAASRPITIKPRDRRGQPSHRAPDRHRRRAARRGTGDRYAPAAGDADHRAAQLAAERRAAERQRAADRICRDRSEHHRAVQCGRGADGAAEPRQDRAAVDGAEAGAEGRRPRAAHRTGQQRSARHRPQHSGGQCAAEPGAQPGVPTTHLHRARRQGHRRVRRPCEGTRFRRPRQAVERRTEWL